MTTTATLDQLVAETGWLHRLAMSLVRDETTAKDLVHDVTVSAESHDVRLVVP